MVSRIVMALILAVVAEARAAIVKGTVILDEVGGRPIANVQIIDSAHTGGPWSSGSDGGFTLDYPARHVGQRVRLLVNKEGYVVLNDVQLDLALPDDPDANPLQVIICKEADREEMARRFYRLKSSDAIEETYRKHVNELEDTQQATAAALIRLQQNATKPKLLRKRPLKSWPRTNQARTRNYTNRPSGCFWMEKARQPANSFVTMMKNAAVRWRKRSRPQRKSSRTPSRSWCLRPSC
jgi:hypothetical protein